MANTILHTTYRKSTDGLWHARQLPNLGAVGEWRYGSPGSYQPFASTTGVPTGTVLTRFPASGTGDFNVTADNTVIDSKDIHGRIKFTGNAGTTAKNLLVQNCIIRGGPAPTGTSGKGIIHCARSGVDISGIVIQDCDIIPENPSPMWEGVYGYDFTLKRCNIRHVHHAIYPEQTAHGPVNVICIANYVHHLGGFSPDPTHSDDKTHNDCVHWAGGDNMQCQYNNFQGFLSKSHDLTTALMITPDPNFAFSNPAGYIPFPNGVDPEGYVGTIETLAGQVAPNTGQVVTVNPYWEHTQSNSVLQVGSAMSDNSTGMLFDSNWCNGGVATINIGTNPTYTTYSGSFTNNRFGRGADGQSHDGNHTYTTLGITGKGFVISNNVYDDDGSAITLR